MYRTRITSIDQKLIWCQLCSALYLSLALLVTVHSSLFSSDIVRCATFQTRKYGKLNIFSSTRSAVRGRQHIFFFSARNIYTATLCSYYLNSESSTLRLPFAHHTKMKKKHTTDIAGNWQNLRELFSSTFLSIYSSAVPTLHLHLDIVTVSRYLRFIRAMLPQWYLKR